MPPGLALSITALADQLAIWRVGPREPLPAEPKAASLWAVVRTADELSVVGPEGEVPEGVPVERGWRALMVAGPLNFELTGVLAALAASLAEAEISIFAISTYDTDYVLVREDRLDDALEALRAGGFEIAS
ncbi:MAG TPA: ACT domain-containing protein [Solirubrobacterales bacterium]|nr:ACT domain-containing protein [Solirubrobacterales bacterium]